MALIYCQDCGNQVSSEALACPKCGRPIVTVNTAPPLKKNLSRTTAGLLALFLGGLGVHKFYLGRPWSGLLYIIFCATLIPAILGLIEGIVLLSSDDATFQAKYCGAQQSAAAPTKRGASVTSIVLSAILFLFVIYVSLMVHWLRTH